MKSSYKKIKSALGFINSFDILLFSFLILSFFMVYISQQGTYKAYALNISASFVFATLLRIIDFYRSAVKNIAFVNFFGDAVLRNGLHLVYPEFELDPALRKSANAIIPDNQRLFVKPVSNSEISRVDVPLCAASNDLRALIEISSIFSDMSGNPPPISSDSRWDQLLESSFISIGFSSNILTLRWLRLANELIERHHDDECLRYSEFITVNTGDAIHKVSHELKSSDDGEIGFIAKYRPDKSRPDIIWFIVAGLGPDATIGSAIFLARKWRTLYRLFREEDFLIILKIKQTVFAHATPLIAVKGGMKLDDLEGL